MSRDRIPSDLRTTLHLKKDQLGKIATIYETLRFEVKVLENALAIHEQDNGTNV